MVVVPEQFGTPLLRILKPDAMKTLPALIAFFVVYYTLWLLSLPLSLLRQFITAIAGDDE